MPGQTKAPTDRLRKQPRRVCVGIYLDDTLADHHQAAAEALQAARAELAQSRLRRLLETKAASDTPIDAADVTTLVDAEDDETLADQERALTEAEAALDAATVWYWFRSVGRTRFRELTEAHPATDADHEAAAGHGGKALWNADTFPRALIHEACINPGLGEADLAEIFDGDTWNEEEVAALFTAALQANTAVRAVTHRKPPPAP